jgi:hypothetical protein
MNILHSYCREELPNSFNDIFATFSYQNHPDMQKTWINRLIRVLEIEDSISDKVRSQSRIETSELDELIPSFSISANEKKKIFQLCAAMRKIVLASHIFDHPHRRRLLNRIAAIEAETEKPRGMFDVVRAGISDLGETLGKFGTDIKPLTDRMTEVVQIARKGSKQYDQLPEPEEVKKLPPPEESDGDQIDHTD